MKCRSHVLKPTHPYVAEDSVGLKDVVYEHRTPTENVDYDYGNQHFDDL